MEKIIGSWSLESFTIEKNKNLLHWGKEPEGLLIYTKDGKMSVNIKCEKRMNIEDEDKFSNRILFYAGEYYIKENQIIHKVQFATNPDRVGKEMTRRFEFSDQKLILIGEGPFGIAKVTWERK